MTRWSRRSATGPNRRQFCGLWQASAVAMIGWSLPAAWADSYSDFFAAARTDRESVVVALTLRGFDLNTLDEQGEHALHIAIRNQSHRVTAFLLEQPSVRVDVRNAHGESPLMLAALKGDLPLVQRLMARGAQVNKPGWTALHYAASHPEEASDAVVALLLEQHAYIDAESPNRTTPLMMAARYGHLRVVKRLIDAGADVTLRNEQGLSALDFARQGQREPAAQLVITALQRRNAAPSGSSPKPSGRW